MICDTCKAKGVVCYDIAGEECENYVHPETTAAVDILERSPEIVKLRAIETIEELPF